MKVNTNNVDVIPPKTDQGQKVTEILKPKHVQELLHLMKALTNYICLLPGLSSFHKISKERRKRRNRIV